MLVDLSGLRALVTGSSRGIGKQIAIKLAACGAVVGVNGRSEAAVAATIGELKAKHPGGYFAAPGDLGSSEGASAVIAACGDIDILVNNAGVYIKCDPFEITDEQWIEAFNDNVLSGVRLTRHYAPRMRDKGFGRIIFVASDTAVAPDPELLPYSAAKSAQVSVARNYAQVLGRTGVTVNSLILGPTIFPERAEERKANAQAAGMSPEDYMRMLMQARRPTSILGRFLEGHEIADFTAFLASREASYATGAAWRLEGGILTQQA